MWSEFWIAVIAATALLYVPGSFFFKGLRFSNILALCCAPLYSACAYAVLPIIYEFAGIPCSALSLVAPTILVALLVFCLSFIKKAPEQSITNPLALSAMEPIRLGSVRMPFDVFVPLVYIAASAIVCTIMFLGNMAEPDGFVCIYDNLTHLNTIRAFLDSHRWSSLHVSSYLASTIETTPYSTLDGSFYPAGWYDYAALVCSVTGANVTLGVNATLACMCMVMLPLGSYIFMRTLFPKERGAIIAGALAVLSFGNHPWRLFTMGPLYPNLYGLLLFTAAMAWIIATIDHGWARHHPFAFLACFAITFAGLALAHPNTVFSLYIFMAVYGATVIARAFRNSTRMSTPIKYMACIVTLVAFVAVVVGVWIGIYHIPRFQGIIGHTPTQFVQAIEQNDFLASLTETIMANKGIFAAGLLCLPFIPMLLRRHNWPILVFPAAFFCVSFLSIRTGNEPISYWTAALWYSDVRRIASNAAIFLAPILALVLGELLGILHRVIAGDARQSLHTPTGKHAKPDTTTVSPTRKVAAILIPSIAVVLYICAVGFAGYRDLYTSMRTRYDVNGAQIYDAQELEFVNEALSITQGDLVLNSPNDGTCWAYGINGLNAYYRSTRYDQYTNEGNLIRLSLAKYARDSSVQHAVQSTGAHYLIQLDHKVAYDDGKWLWQYNKKDRRQWRGIDAVGDDTPGFEIVLKEGDMRLYRIKDLG